VTGWLARRHVGPGRRAVPWFLAAVLLASVGLPAAAGAFGRLPVAPQIGLAHPLNVTSIEVNMTDTPRFAPAYVSVPAGANTTFHLVNQGTYTHTFTLLAQPGVVLNTSWTPTQLDSYLAQNGSLANVSIAPNSQFNETVPFNKSTAFESFEFVSTVPYQFQAGMYGFVNVTSTQAGLQVSENTSDQLQFLPNALSATASHFPFNLDVLVTNMGAFAHTFTVAPQSNVTLSPANFTQYLQQHAPLVRANVPTGAGATVWANFTVSAPGVYEYICEIPGHFASGMSGFLYVDVPLPPPVAPLSTAIIQGWVLAGSAVLLGIGVLLATVSAYVGQFPKGPEPPETMHH
jgi:uncharacterized cupredoxin-like copper-binding protein